jgi:MoaE-MoaD fusion protein
MIRRVRCFAVLRERTGGPEMELDLPEGATVADLKAAVEARIPELAGRLGAVRVAADYAFLGDADPLPPGAELALIPPVSGGAPRPGEPDAGPDRVRLSAEPLSLAEAVEAVHGPDAGAVVTFSGTVRNDSAGRRVRQLGYEAYGGMALEKLASIAARARSEQGALRVAVFHRTGVLEVGETAVVIAVAAAHRAEAFAACREIIEALKSDVPIWKKEVGEDGESWSGWGP